MTVKKLKAVFQNLENLDEKSVEFLLKAIDASNLPGFDYLEFKQSLNALQTLNMDEEIAMKSAYATGSTVGLTKVKLIKSAQHYRGVLQKEKEQFDAALQKQMFQRVEHKISEKTELAKKVQQYQEKITQLKVEIQKIEEKLGKADNEIKGAQLKIEGTKNKFETTFDALISQIDSDIDKLNNLL